MRTPEELDRQYNARAAVPDHPAYIARWQADSAQERRTLAADLDLAYGASGAERLDLFHAGDAAAPLLVFIHGGYWRALDKGDFGFLAPALVARGVKLAVVNYGLAPATSIEQMVRQMLSAVAWLHEGAAALGIDRRRIVIAGHSAGAHLAAMMAAADWPAWRPSLPARLVRGVVCISGLYDLAPVARVPFLRDDLRLNAASARKLSPIGYRPRSAVPVVTAVGGEESAEFRRQNALIRSAWPDCFLADVPLPGRNHFSAVDALADPAHPLFRATLDLLGAS